jgi:predicted alpha/beta superfamily hydrolase
VDFPAKRHFPGGRITSFAKCLFILLLASTFASHAQTPIRLAGVSGTAYRFNNFPSKFTDARNVDVWLPPGYENQRRERYPVLYMHDGQNLFAARDSTSGTEWGVDETMLRLISENRIRKAIVVAVWSTPKRTLEFMPEKAFEKATAAVKLKNRRRVYTNSGSDDYLRFLVRELKPFIDRRYRTLRDRANTFIMGSSMGGLMSLYAIAEYPRVFGGAACLSTQFALGKGAMVSYMQRRLPSPKGHVIYFDQGTLSLDRENALFQSTADVIMQKKGYRAGVNWLSRRFPGEGHDEASWRKRLSFPLIFLLGKYKGTK